MPEFASYQVWLLGHDAEKVAQLFPGDDFMSVAWQHRLNEPGVWRAEIVADTATKDLFVVDYQVLVERNVTKSETGWYEEFVGFYLDSEEWYEGDDVDEHYWAAMGYSPEWLVNQPLLQPLRNVGNDNWSFYDKWWAFGKADDIVKLMAAESMFASPDIDRNFSRFAVEGYKAAGEEGCYEGEWVRLLDAIQDTIGEDGQRGNCDFRVEKVGGGYEFKTYSPYYGTDRREGVSEKPTVFSLEFGNMRNPRRRVLRSQEVTAAYGGWQGGGMERTVYPTDDLGGRMNAEALADSPYRRREQFYDVRDTSTPDSILSYLDQKLIDDGKREEVEFDLVQTAGCLYGRDWWIGDLCTAKVFGNTYSVRITEAVGRIDGESEETIAGKAELWTRD